MEGCSQCMVGWQVEAGRGRKEGRNVGRPDASNVRFVRNCAAAEGGRQGNSRSQPGQQGRKEWHAVQAGCLLASFV